MNDTSNIRLEYAENITAKLPADKQEVFRHDIRKLVLSAERIEFAKKLLALNPSQVLELIETYQAKGMIGSVH